MKKFIFIIPLTLFSVFCCAQSDYEMIEKTLWSYLKGDTEKDYDTLKTAFHEQATMKYVSSTNGYTAFVALEAFKDIQGKEPEKNRINRIEYITIAGRAASAKIEIEYPDVVVVDFMNLLRVDGEWKIVNKIFSRK